MFEFLFSTGDHKTGSSLVALKVAGISEGKESFTNHLIRLMCGTRDHLDAFPQSIVNNSYSVSANLCISYTPHAVTLMKLVS